MFLNCLFFLTFCVSPITIFVYDYMTDYKHNNLCVIIYSFFIILYSATNIFYGIRQNYLIDRHKYYRSYKQSPMPPKTKLTSRL